MTGSPDPSSPYDAYYFAHGCGRPYQRDEEWLGFFRNIAGRIAADIQPATALDAGCAMGFLVEGLRAQGVQAWGIDIAEYAIERVHPEIQPYCSVGSVTQPFPQTYDLIVCIEVLEHLPVAEGERAVTNLCQHTGDVLFSSTPLDYKEATHFNVQPPDYWAGLFARHGFYRDVDFDARFISDWAVRFRRLEEPTYRIVQNYERKLWQLWQENTGLRVLSGELRSDLAGNEGEITALRAQNKAILESRTWKLIQKVAHLRSLFRRK